MKRSLAIWILCFVLISCDNQSASRKYNDEASDLTTYDDDRQKQIKRARHNKELVPGKWKIIRVKATKQDEYELASIKENEMLFDTYEFLPQSNYVFYKGKKVVEKGTIEWMAEDREIVFTPNIDAPVSRLLIWNINHKYMKASSRTSYMILKKLPTDSIVVKSKITTK